MSDRDIGGGVAATTIGRRLWVGLCTVLAPTFMTQVGGFVVNVASPSIQWISMPDSIRSSSWERRTWRRSARC